ncbi:MAG: PilZ domain-containing protein [Phycisphaerae bacterium]|nr:PilZ domain-containing protein [Phycisphaerae bacterium]
MRTMQGKMDGLTSQDASDRRDHRRLGIRLPVEVTPVHADSTALLRTVTCNVSTGGIYFESPPDYLQAGTDVRLDLTIPPGDGYSPYSGRVSAVAKVLRVEPLLGQQHARDRIGVAARFRNPPKLDF